jgi:hypothetical protein
MDAIVREIAKQKHPQVTFMKCLWPELNFYQVSASNTLYQLLFGLPKQYLLQVMMKLLMENDNNCPIHIIS